MSSSLSSTAVILTQSQELAAALIPPQTLTGLGIFLNAVIQTLQNKLSLYHAIIIMYLISFLGLGVASTGSYGVSPARKLIWVWGWTLSSLVYAAWSLYVYAKAPTFGPDSECNNTTVLVLFWVSIRATVLWFRILYFVGAGFSLVLLLMIHIPSSIATICIFLRVPFNTLWQPHQQEFPRPSIPFRDRVERMIKFVIPQTFTISWAEIMIKRNHVGQGEYVWTFGQTLALVLLLGPALAIISYLLSRWERRIGI